jgi:hypothetical protein
VGINLNRVVTVDWFLVSHIVTDELAQIGQKRKRWFISQTFVLYASQNWSLTLREEPRLRVFENRALRRVFGPTRDEVTGEWRKLHNEEHNDLYSSPNIVQVIKSRRMWAGHLARVGDSRDVYWVLVRKPEEKETTWNTQAQMGGKYFDGF